MEMLDDRDVGCMASAGLVIIYPKHFLCQQKYFAGITKKPKSVEHDA